MSDTHWWATTAIAVGGLALAAFGQYQTWHDRRARRRGALPVVELGVEWAEKPRWPNQFYLDLIVRNQMMCAIEVHELRVLRPSGFLFSTTSEQDASGQTFWLPPRGGEVWIGGILEPRDTERTLGPTCQQSFRLTGAAPDAWNGGKFLVELTIVPRDNRKALLVKRSSFLPIKVA